MSADDIRCATCVWWSEGAPPTATATRNLDPRSGFGTCELNPPTVVYQMGKAFSYFPETAADRSCGAWQSDTIGDGDDGERVGGDVVPIRSAAA